MITIVSILYLLSQLNLTSCSHPYQWYALEVILHPQSWQGKKSIGIQLSNVWFQRTGGQEFMVYDLALLHAHLYGEYI